MNESANAIDDVAGTAALLPGRGGDAPARLVARQPGASTDAPDLEFDFVNLPAMPEGSAGDQGSVIGVETGYMVNANSPNIDLAVEFLALVNSPENVAKFVRRRRSSRWRPRSRMPAWTDARSRSASCWRARRRRPAARHRLRPGGRQRALRGRGRRARRPGLAGRRARGPRRPTRPLTAHGVGRLVEGARPPPRSTRSPD